MKGVNKVIIVGTLGDDPTTNQHGDTTFATLSLATNDSWKDKNTGEQKEHTEWHRVSLAGSLAEVASQYLTKGSQVYVEGSLQTRKWQDKSGNDKYTTEVKGYNMQMLGGKSKPKPGEGSGQQGGPMRDEPPADDFDDLIPFS